MTKENQGAPIGAAAGLYGMKRRSGRQILRVADTDGREHWLVPVPRWWQALRAAVLRMI